MIYLRNDEGIDEMSDMERVGLVKDGEVHKVTLEIIEFLKKQEPDIVSMYKTGNRLVLTNKGLMLTDRKEIGVLRKRYSIYTIIEVLTVEELYRFMSDYYNYIKQGQSSAVMQIMMYKLKECMDDVYEDNYEVIFKNLEIH